MVPPHRAPFRGRLRGREHGTRTEGGCPIPPFHFSASLFGFFVLDRPTRTAPAERGETGATPLILTAGAVRQGGGVPPSVPPGVPSLPRLRGGRSRLHVSLREGSPARTRAGRSAETSGPMLDRLIRAFLVVGGVSVACAWTWPGAFPEADPVAVLVRYHTPNVYRAVVAWYYVAPGVAALLAGQFLISTSRIWFARMGVSLGLRSRLPTWPLSPSADGWRGCRSGHRRQGPIWTSVRGAGVKADSLAPRRRSGARRLDAGEHTRMVLARRCRQ